MYDSRFEEPKAEDRYLPDDTELKFIQKVYTDLVKDAQIKTNSYHLLGDRALQQYWDDCRDDYNVYVPPQRSDDWMKMYRRPIVRDKANAFIAHIVKALIVPVVKAQNKNQDTDRVVSRVLRGLLDWAEKNDGRPSTSGMRKMVDFIHTMVVEGTVHVQVDFDVDEGRAAKTLVPNEEIYIANLWEPDIQKQPHLIRLQDKVTYEQAREEFGDLDNFKYVVPGESKHWQLGETPFFKELNIGRLGSDEVHIIRVWRPVPKDKLGSGKKREKYFNILVNGVLMFDVDKKSGYKGGFYNIGKEVFEEFDPRFYWGNSLCNKGRENQKIYDAFFTLILNKGKINANPPMASLNGLHVDQDIVWPGKITAVEQDPTKDLVKIPGVADPVSQSEVAILSLLESSLDTSTAAPIVAGQSGGGNKTAREVVLQESNARKLLEAFVVMISNLVEQLAYLELPILIQFVPRKKIDGIARITIPGQQLGAGRRGSMEVIFHAPPPMSQDEMLQASGEILKQETASASAGTPKETVYIDPAYLNDLDLYVEVEAETLFKPDTATERALELEKFQVYRSSPVFNQEEAARALVRAWGDDEDTMILNQQQMQPQTPLGNPSTPTADNLRAGALSQAAPLGALQ